MATDVVMPALGLTQDTGKVLRWLVAEGQAVGKGEPLMEIETDKVTVEVESPAAGVLAGIRVAVGQEVPVGQAIAVILEPGESVSAAAPVTEMLQATRATRPVTPPPAPARSSAASARTVPASPKARRLAQELGVDLSIVRGTGPGGEITAADVQAASSPAQAPQRIAPAGVWKVMAERLTQSWTTAPHFYLSCDARADRLNGWRDRLRDRIPQVTHTDLLVKLAAIALRRHPGINARWEGGTIVPRAEIEIGIAVAVESGLVVPVIRHPDELGIEDIAAARHDLVTRAQAGRLRPEDVRGGTFTISNLGMHGVDAFSAILNPPQAAILAVGRIVDRVIAESGEAVVRPMLTFTLTCDHRAIDGVRGAEFLMTFVRLIEDPDSTGEGLMG